MRDAVITRFAPSPTGLLHLGHAYSALYAFDYARRRGGRFLLRIEDIDTSRCRPAFAEAIFEDLAWLGLGWEEPVRYQSRHFSDYAQALDILNKKRLLYPCFCTRKDIRAEIEDAARAPHLVKEGPDGPLYPGTCRRLSDDERARRIESGDAYALRLDMRKAVEAAGALSWVDEHAGEQQAQPELFGDVVLARKDTPTSYHLSVTVDDADQGMSQVVRGMDLFQATHIHRLLQALLDLPTPLYVHHDLVLDENGKRFAKRDKAATLQGLREQGVTPGQIRARLGP